MFVLYSPNGVVEAITTSMDFASHIARHSDRVEEWDMSHEYEDIPLDLSEKFQKTKLKYVIYDTSFLFQIHAIVRTPEIVLNTILNDPNDDNEIYDWDTRIKNEYFELYISPGKKNVRPLWVKGGWQKMAAIPNEGTKEERLEKIMLQFCSRSDYVLTLKGSTIAEYCHIFKTAIFNPLGIDPDFT